MNGLGPQADGTALFWLTWNDNVRLSCGRNGISRMKKKKIISEYRPSDGFQIFMNDVNGNGTLADRRSHPPDGALPHITGSKNTGHTGL